MRIQKSSKYCGGCGSWEWGLRWPTLNNIIHRDIGNYGGLKITSYEKGWMGPLKKYPILRNTFTFREM